MCKETVLRSSLLVVIQLNLLTDLQGRHYFSPHFTDEKTEAERVKERSQGHTASKVISRIQV